MTVCKMFFLLTFPFICFSQSKNNDVYYELKKNNKDYVLIINDTNNVNSFRFFDKKEYMEREKQVLKDKKDGNFKGYQFYKRPTSYNFRKVYNSKVDSINHCDTHFINLVNYKWIQDNTWKENNPNVLFKDLYFLIKINKDKYLKYKVRRTIIAR